MRTPLYFEPHPRITLLGRRGTPLQRVALLAMALIVLVFSVVVGWELWGIQLQERDLTVKREALQFHDISVSHNSAAMERRPMLQPKAAEDWSARSLSDDQKRIVNGAINQLNVPWHDLFVQLDRFTPKDVGLLSVEPDGPRGVIKIQAEAKSLDALLAYASGLQFQNVLGQLTYSKHETNEQDPNKPIRLAFELALRAPAGLQAQARIAPVREDGLHPSPRPAEGGATQ